MLDRLPLVTAAASVLAAYLVLGLPLAGALGRHALADRLREDPAQRLTLYRQLIRHQSLLAGVAAAIVGLSGLPATALGLRPTGESVHNVGGTWGTALLVAAGMSLLLVRAPLSVAHLMPKTSAERRLYVAVAMTAGTAEELLYRGFLMLFLTDVAGWSWQSAALGSALAFGVGHAYQGLRAAVTVCAAGFLLAEIYVQTASLLLPVLIHVAIDLRALKSATAPAASPAGRRRETPADR